MHHPEVARIMNMSELLPFLVTNMDSIFDILTPWTQLQLPSKMVQGAVTFSSAGSFPSAWLIDLNVDPGIISGV